MQIKVVVTVAELTSVSAESAVFVTEDVTASVFVRDPGVANVFEMTDVETEVTIA